MFDTRSVLLEISERFSGRNPEYKLNDTNKLKLTIYSARMEKKL